MKKASIALVISIAFILFASRAKAQVKSKSFQFVLQRLLSHNVPEISVAKTASSPNLYTLLDTREYDEYAVSHLPQAIFTGYKDFEPEVLKNLRKDQPIVVYCSVGKRSENITAKLIKQGFTNVQNLYGGIFEWVNQGQPVYDNQNNQTEKVHVYNRLWGRFLDKGKKVF